MPDTTSKISKQRAQYQIGGCKGGASNKNTNVPVATAASLDFVSSCMLRNYVRRQYRIAVGVHVLGVLFSRIATRLRLHLARVEIIQL